MRETECFVVNFVKGIVSIFKCMAVSRGADSITDQSKTFPRNGHFYGMIAI